MQSIRQMMRHLKRWIAGLKEKKAVRLATVWQIILNVKKSIRQNYQQRDLHRPQLLPGSRESAGQWKSIWLCADDDTMVLFSLSEPIRKHIENEIREPLFIDDHLGLIWLVAFEYEENSLVNLAARTGILFATSLKRILTCQISFPFIA